MSGDRVALPTGVKLSDLRNPRWRKQSNTRARLARVVSYMIENADKITPLGFGQGHLDPWLHLAQRKATRGPEEARLVYGPCQSYHRLPVRYLVRRIVWDRDGDLDRAVRRQVVYPSTTITNFHLAGKRLERANECARNLGKSMRTLSLDLGFEAEPPPEESSGEFRVAKTPGWWRLAMLPGHPARVQLNFNSNWLRGKINEAWEELWDALGAACRADRKIERVRVSYYPVSLKAYARSLAHGMTR